MSGIVVSDSGTTTLTIAMGTGDTLAVVSNGTSYTFSSTTADFEPFALNTDPANQATAFSGFGTMSLMLTSTGITQYHAGEIRIIDTGSGDTVTFNDSGANAYADNFDVELSDPGAGGIAFNGNSSFGIFSLRRHDEEHRAEQRGESQEQLGQHYFVGEPTGNGDDRQLHWRGRQRCHGRGHR